MTDSIFFDNDCLSAFLWVKNESILVKLYPRQIYLPRQVYVELSAPGISHLKARVDTLLDNKQISIAEISVGTDMYNLFYKLTKQTNENQKIGAGEAAAIALAKFKDGIIASNNLKDISFYIKEFNLKHITTGDILVEAYNKNYITEKEGNSIWSAMLAKRRKLGSKSFSEYLQSKNV